MPATDEESANGSGWVCRGALLLGYAALDEDEIREGVRRLAVALALG